MSKAKVPSQGRHFNFSHGATLSQPKIVAKCLILIFGMKVAKRLLEKSGMSNQLMQSFLEGNANLFKMII